MFTYFSQFKRVQTGFFFCFSNFFFLKYKDCALFLFIEITSHSWESCGFVFVSFVFLSRECRPYCESTSQQTRLPAAWQWAMDMVGG